VLLGLILSMFAAGACTDSMETAIQVVIADGETARDGLWPGGPLSGGTIRLYQADTVTLEVLLDDNGLTTVSPPPGTYTVQVSLEGGEPGCFWGNTVSNTQFPQPNLLVEAFQICSG
jgi:hypothetical protein